MSSAIAFGKAQIALDLCFPTAVTFNKSIQGKKKVLAHGFPGDVARILFAGAGTIAIFLFVWEKPIGIQ